MAAASKENKQEKQKVVSKIHRKKRGVDWFYILSALILVYLIVQVVRFADNDDIALFEVKTSESINTNRQYSGLITREEYVYQAEHDGYINFYVGNGKKASAGATVYTMDESGELSQLLIEASNDGSDLSRESLLALKEKMVTFSTGFDQMNFQEVYSVKNTIAVSVLDALNEEAVQKLAESSLGDAFFKISAEQSGFVMYQSDAYDGADGDSLKADDLKSHIGESKITENGAWIKKGDFVYKIVKDDCFSIHFLLSEEDMNRIGKNLSYTDGFPQAVYFNNLGYTLDGQMYLELLGDGTVCARIDFISMGSNFLSSRFVNFELVDEEINGLKIPSSAITEKAFFMVPAEYRSVNTSGKVVFFKDAVDAQGNPSVQSINAQIYGVVTESVESENTEGEMITEPVDRWYYINAEDLSLGDTLRMPDGTGTYTVSNQVSLKGVYLANQGYTEFRQITVLGETDDHEYTIIARGTRYGISPFDYIVMDGSAVEEYQVLFY